MLQRCAHTAGNALLAARYKLSHYAQKKCSPQANKPLHTISYPLKAKNPAQLENRSPKAKG
jgi:hypothetical protein